MGFYGLWFSDLGFAHEYSSCSWWIGGCFDVNDDPWSYIYAWQWVFWSLIQVLRNFHEFCIEEFMASENKIFGSLSLVLHDMKIIDT